MINQLELPDYMVKSMPELSESIRKQANYENVYDTVKQLLHYTQSQIKKQDFKAVKKCFNTADKIYKKGNNIVKTAIENVFIYSFSHMLFKNEERTKQIAAMIPQDLYALYLQQILNSHL